MSEPETKDSTRKPSRSGLRLPMLAVATLLAAGVAFILTPQQLRYFLACEQRRDLLLRKPETRDSLGSVAFYRKLDQQLPPDARIFFSGMVGTNNRLFPYYYARTFLFPREVEISLDHQADFQVEGFEGMDCASPEQLRTNGYDLMLRVGTDHNVATFPLTEKGAVKP